MEAPPVPIAIVSPTVDGEMETLGIRVEPGVGPHDIVQKPADFREALTGDEEIVTPAVNGVVKGDLGMEATRRPFCFSSGAIQIAVLVRSNLSWWGVGHGGGGRVGGEGVREQTGDPPPPLPHTCPPEPLCIYDN